METNKSINERWERNEVPYLFAYFTSLNIFFRPPYFLKKILVKSRIRVIRADNDIILANEIAFQINYINRNSNRMWPDNIYFTIYFKAMFQCGSIYRKEQIHYLVFQHPPSPLPY